MAINMSEVDLDAPAFPSQGEESVPADGPQPTKVEESIETPVTPPTTGGEPEEQRVPYSRLKEVVERAREAERRADEAFERLNSLERDRSDSRDYRSRRDTDDETYRGSLPAYWSAMYGDNENSRKAYTYELERQNAIREEARQYALEAVRSERTQESQVIAQNEHTLDERIEDLSYSLGRELTEQEESALLDIVDEYTPTGPDGKYAGEIMSFDKAWEIYTLRTSQAGRRSTEQRRAPTALTSARTEGVPASKAEADKNWNPRDWNSWKKRIPN